ncbi:MAG TPA: RHS repeat-associated core domain-containing protein, partial [Egibacteraceae bacterium]|nr:RHS repeat-associated core domain-containing protein [Egibacteraceae bacterium]
RITSREDAKLNKTVYEYDRNDNVTAVADPEGKTTRTSHDQRDMPVEVSEPLTASRRVVTRMEYDAVGNLTRTVHPRGYDVAGGTGPFDRFTTTYTYDDADQLVRVNLPSATAAGDSSDKYYVHRRYDANGNLRLTTLPTGVLDTSDDLDAVPAEAKTRITHFDTGWIRTSDENLASGDNDPQPTVQFDYWPEGWQKERTPLKRDGTGRDDEETMTWAYFNDGQLRERKDNDGQASEYKYDANNNLRHALDGGVEGTAVYPRVIRLGHDPLDRVSVSRERERRPDGDTSPKGNFNTTEFGYDLNHNVLTRVENIVEKPDLTRVEDGRTHTFTYEPNDWLASHLDGGKTTAVTDDRRILNEFDKTGRELRRRVQKRTGSDSYTLKQTTEWTWFDNGKLETLKTSTPASGIIEQHTVGYVDNNIYMNGHRVTDTFLRKGPGVTSCASSTCTARYEYDARDRLTKETPGHGPYTTYKLDAAGNVELEETFTAAGAKTKSTTMTYAGNQLQTVKTGSDTPQRHHYDLQGRLECVVLEPQPSTRDICATATNGSLNPRMLAHYRYDYLDRMIRFRSFRSDGVNAPRNDDDSRYVYDALDRVDTQREQHWDPAGALTSARTTAYSYLGLTSMVSTETHTQGVAQTPGAEIRTRSYGYDAFGHRVSMTDDPAGPEAPKDYTYGYDVHGSVSQLVADAGTVSAAYGYKAYGAADPALSGGDTSTDDPVNPYRYTAKRLDSGSGQLDMGARRFTPDTGRFVQRDQYHDALGDLRLGTDPLTGNRYALAAGNPLSFVEADGHAPIPDGGGGSTSSPTTSENDELWGWERTAVATSGTTPTQKRTSASSGGGGTPSGTSDWRRGEQASRRDYQTLQRTQNYAEAGTASGLALHEAGLMTRDRASRAAREMRLGHDALTRSQGAKTLAEYRHSRWGTGISRAWSNPALRGLTRGGAVIGAGASYASNVSEGEDWKVAAAETAAETAGAWGGAKLGFVIGCAAGPVGCFVGAALGGIVGGVATAFAVDQTQEYVRRD